MVSPERVPAIVALCPAHLLRSLAFPSSAYFLSPSTNENFAPLRTQARVHSDGLFPDCSSCRAPHWASVIMPEKTGCGAGVFGSSPPALAGVAAAKTTAAPVNRIARASAAASDALAQKVSNENQERFGFTLSLQPCLTQQLCLVRNWSATLPAARMRRNLKAVFGLQRSQRK